MLEYHLAFEKRTLPEMRNTQESRTQWRVESTSKTLADVHDPFFATPNTCLVNIHLLPLQSQLDPNFGGQMMFKSQLLLVKKSQEHQAFQFWMVNDGDLGTSLEALWGTWLVLPTTWAPLQLAADQSDVHSEGKPPDP